MAQDPYAAFDGIETRCPRLGGEVVFGYCRKVNSGLPCRKSLTCFQLLFPVEAFFRRALKEETFSDLFENSGETRMEKILRTFSEAQERVGKDGPGPEE